MKSQELARANTALRVAIVESTKTQRTIARRVRMDETRLSKIVRGHESATPRERKALARVLHRTEAELFGDALVEAVSA